MSDNLRRYRAIDEALMQLHPVEPTWCLRQSIQVLAMFINGVLPTGTPDDSERMGCLTI